jgi:hypothetical protein
MGRITAFALLVCLGCFCAGCTDFQGSKEFMEDTNHALQPSDHFFNPPQDAPQSVRPANPSR